MNPKRILAEIRDELDSRQIVATFELTPLGVIVTAPDYASELIAKREIRRRGLILLNP